MKILFKDQVTNPNTSASVHCEKIQYDEWRKKLKRYEWNSFSTSARILKETGNVHKRTKLLGKVNENLKNMKLPF